MAVDNQILHVIKSLFNARKDVFAIHWEKGKKSGYMPAYHFDPFMFRMHRMSGGTFKDYQDKTYLPLTEKQILKHLKGEQLIGIYPLMPDNTSWFIAADFDQENWVDECKIFIRTCEEKGIPAYLERSRSGNGGHVWVFFEKPYPASKSRKIITSLLEQSGIFSVFDKSSSFDRLFPNQDFHSGKGLGNLIALPFFKPALEKGNSCFVDENLEPYPDQWEFLFSIQKVTVQHLDKVFETISSPVNDPSTKDKNSNQLIIRLCNSIRINRSGIHLKLINFLKEELNFANAEYYVKKNSGRNTWGTTRYFRFIEETGNEVIIPRGFIGKLLRYCKKEQIEVDFKDERLKHKPVLFKTNFTLKKHQRAVIEIIEKKDFGVITAPPGSGKTIIALQIIANKQQPALIIVHRKQLIEQWIERIQAFLGIPKNEIGKIGQGKAMPGEKITIAMIQSLGKYLEKNQDKDFKNSFGTLIIDECHHIPAETFRKTISEFNSYYQYGLTATPFRKGNDDKIIFSHIGKIIADIKPQQIEEFKKARVEVRKTDLDVPFNSRTDTYETLSKILVHDSARNKLILNDVSY